MGLPPRSAILWGSSFENVLTFSYPWDEVTIGRTPREGAEWAQAPSGTEEAALVGHDYTLEGVMQWISRAEWSGPTGVQAWLDAARNKQTFRFVPDANVPAFYLDGCYLAEPLRGIARPAVDASLNTPLTIRNPTVDFGLALRGLMYEYGPALDIASDGITTFARAAAANYHGVAPSLLVPGMGRVTSAAAGVLRNRHYANGLLSTLLEMARTNSLLWSEDANNAAYGKTNATVIITQPSPDGGFNAQFIREDGSAAAAHTMQQSATIGAGEYLGASCYLKTAGRNKHRFRVIDGADQFHMTVDLAAGTVTASGSAGAAVLVSAKIEGPFFEGPSFAAFWRLKLVGALNGSSTTATVQWIMQDAGGNETYDGGATLGFIYFGGQLERMGTGSNGGGCSSYIKTTTVATARANSDNFKAAHTFLPQPSWWYLKFVEQGTSHLPFGSPFGIKGAANPTVRIYLTPANKYYFHYNVDGAAGSVSVLGGGDPLPTVGDVVELLGTIDELGRATMMQSINGGAQATGGTGGAAAWVAAWSAPEVHVNQVADNSVVGQIALIRAACGPLTFGGQTIDTIAKARAV